MNVFTAWSACLDSDADWLLHGDNRYSGNMAACEIACYCAGLAACGAGPGTRVLMRLAPDAPSLFIYLALLRSGCVAIPLATGWQADDLEAFLKDCEPQLLVCDAALAKQLETRKTAGLHMVTPGSLHAAGGKQDAPAPAERADSDAALLLYSAGTTAAPRAAVLTHGRLAANAAAVSGLWRLDRHDVLIAALPLLSPLGLFAALHPALAAGSALRIENTIAAVAQAFGHSTLLVAEPHHYRALLHERSWRQEHCRGMRLFVSTAAHLPPQLAEAFAERSGRPPRQCYGTSAAGLITAHDADGPFRVDSSGKMLPGTRLRIVGDNLKPMPLEHQGEIQLPAFEGGWLKDAATSLTADGWFRTGDIGMWDENGFITVVGKAVDVIHSGPYRIYPEDVEHALLAIDGVAEAAVIGRPHGTLGQAVHAWVVRAPDSALNEAGLRAALAERLAHYQQPAALHFVQRLPRNPLGRLQKASLRSSAT